MKTARPTTTQTTPPNSDKLSVGGLSRTSHCNARLGEAGGQAGGRAREQTL